jgi:hypothetical protein
MDGGFCRIAAGELGIHARLFQFQLVEKHAALVSKPFVNLSLQSKSWPPLSTVPDV